jgi:hypothetical protein
VGGSPRTGGGGRVALQERDAIRSPGRHPARDAATAARAGGRSAGRGDPWRTPSAARPRPPADPSSSAPWRSRCREPRSRDASLPDGPCGSRRRRVSRPAGSSVSGGRRSSRPEHLGTYVNGERVSAGPCWPWGTGSAWGALVSSSCSSRRRTRRWRGDARRTSSASRSSTASAAASGR